MTPADIGVFELLAAVFTLSFIALVFFIWRFIRNLDVARARMGGGSRGLRGLPDPERGAVQFRVRGAETPAEEKSQNPTGR
jgi:hypothetical protein